MKTSALIAASFAFFFAAATARAADVPENVRVWKFGGKGGNIKSQNTYSEGTGYNLFLQTNSKYLTWKRQPLGINLDYVSDASLKKIHLRLPDQKEREILSGEVIAFGIGGGSAFLRYADRTAGVNLEWSKSPVYQWRIFGSNVALGQPIPTGSFLAIANDKVDPRPDFMVFVERPPGMWDGGWTSSPEFFNKLGNAGAKLAVKAAKAYFGGGL